MPDMSVINRLVVPERQNRADLEQSHSQNDFIARLARGIESSKQFMVGFRKTRKAMIERFCGANYGEDNRPQRPFNTLYLMGSVLAPLLVAQNPRADVRMADGTMTPFAATFAAKLDNLNNEIALDETLRMLVFDSLFGPSIVLVGLADSGEGIVESGYLHDQGQVFVDRVSPDDYLPDSFARTREAMQFEGHVYERTKEYLLDSGLYKNTAFISGGSDDRGDQDRAERISGKRESDGRLVETVGLIDVWLPPSNPWGGDVGVIVTLSADRPANGVMRVAEYHGPERGPYEMLHYTPIPDNLIHLPPTWVWEATDELINVLARKVKRQAERAKRINVYNIANADDAKLIRSAMDGEFVGLRDVSQVKEIQFGGQSDDTWRLVQELLGWQSKLGGNMDQVGGIGTTGDPTATEVSTLQENAMVRINDMRGQVERFVAKIMVKEGFYLYTDELADEQVATPIDGVDLDIRQPWTPAKQEADYLDFNIRVQPYSMQRQDPKAKSDRTIGFLERVVMPLLPFAQQQGAMLDVARMIGQLAKDQDTGLTPYWTTVSDAMAQAQSPLQTQMVIGSRGQEPQRPGVSGRPGGFRQPQPLTGGTPNANATRRPQTVGKGA